MINLSSATHLVYSDASDSGYGGYSVEVGPHFAHGLWSKDEAGLSSTWRELKAVFNVLRAPKLRCEMVTMLAAESRMLLLKYVSNMALTWRWNGSLEQAIS